MVGASAASSAARQMVRGLLRSRRRPRQRGHRLRGFGNDRSRLSSHGSRGERSRLLALPSVGIQRIQGDGIQQLIRRATIPAIRVQCRTKAANVPAGSPERFALPEASRSSTAIIGLVPNTGAPLRQSEHGRTDHQSVASSIRHRQ